jgi:hypothetical protein
MISARSRSPSNHLALDEHTLAPRVELSVYRLRFTVKQEQQR